MKLLQNKHNDYGTFKRCIFKNHGSLKLILILSFSLVRSFSITAQNTAGILLKVTDSTGRPLSGVRISLFELSGGDFTECVQCADTTDEDGGYSRRNLQVGTYKVYADMNNFHPRSFEVSIDGKIPAYKEIILYKSKTIKINTVIEPKVLKGTPDVPIYKVPGDVVILTNPAVVSTSGGISVIGNRPETNQTRVDNMVFNGVAPGTLGLSSQTLMSTGIRAMYGDFTGGMFDRVTNNPTIKFNLIFEARTSQFLDPYSTNALEGFVSGPIWVKKEKNEYNKTKEVLKLGYAFSGTLNYNKDNSPSANGVYYVKDEVLKDIEQNPLVVVPGNYVHRGNYLTMNDLEYRKAHLNSPIYQANMWGKLVFNFNSNVALTAYTSYLYNQGLNATNQIMNYKQNARFDNRYINSYLILNHNFKTNKRSVIKSASYQVRAEYQNSNSMTRDATHLNNLFDYGYIGKFKAYTADQFALASVEDPTINRKKKAFINQFGDTVYLNDYYQLVGRRDTLLTFDAESPNNLRARYTQNLFEYYQSLNRRFTSMNELVGATGLRNGDNLSSVYNLWAVPGTITSDFSKSNTQRYGINAIGQIVYQPKTKNETQRYPHALQFGFSYEQQVQRSYSVRANQLWSMMRQLLNKQLDGNDIDPNSAIQHAILSYDKNGNFTDTVRFPSKINFDEQSNFDRNLRKKLIRQGARDVYGKPVDENTYLSSDQYDPSYFSLDMFSADELLNNGNSLVEYYGYDYLGNKLKGRPSPQDFINNAAARSIGSFQPVYTAVWLEDQFQFKELVFSAGLRVDRYDANQLVLKDPYSLYPIKTAGEIEGKTLGNAIYKRPSNIGEDFNVYVDDIESPDKVVGYRNGDRWYNSEGVELQSPEIIANSTKTGRIAPLLVSPQKQVLSRESLRDFIPIVNILPRLLFTFPLQQNRKFFTVSYDVLSQRPSSSYSRLSIDDLYYLKQRQGSLLANGDLQSRIRTNYEVSYKQAYGRGLNNGIDLSVSYSEIRKDFGLYQVIQSYPVTYNTYRNIDFSNVTAFKSIFQFNKKGPFSFFISYTYQVADGTGSNVNAQAALIASGQPNLRNIIPLGELDIRHILKGLVSVQWGGRGYDPITRKKLYTGPVVMGQDILRNTGINFIANAISGAPYTPATEPAQIGSLDRQQIKGEPYGARMPWTYTFSVTATKGFVVGKDTKNPCKAEVFIDIRNLLNTKNITGVYRFTGSASDDGFLNSPKGKQAIENQLSAQSFIDMYKTYLNTNAAYGAPRRVQFGLRFYFGKAQSQF